MNLLIRFFLYSGISPPISGSWRLPFFSSGFFICTAFTPFPFSSTGPEVLHLSFQWGGNFLRSLSLCSPPPLKSSPFLHFSFPYRWQNFLRSSPTRFTPPRRLSPSLLFLLSPRCPPVFLFAVVNFPRLSHFFHRRTVPSLWSFSFLFSFPPGYGAMFLGLQRTGAVDVLPVFFLFRQV